MSPAMTFRFRCAGTCGEELPLARLDPDGYCVPCAALTRADPANHALDMTIADDTEVEATTEVETLASVQADSDHTARSYAAVCSLASVPTSDLAAWIANMDADNLTVTPVGTGFVVTFTDDFDGHPVASTVAVAAGMTPADLGHDVEMVRHATEVAQDLDRIWVETQHAATLKQMHDEWCRHPAWDED